MISFRHYTDTKKSQTHTYTGHENKRETMQGYLSEPSGLIRKGSVLNV